VAATLVTYTLGLRHPDFILAFAGAFAMGSAYGFLQGAWPFGVVEAICALVAVRRRSIRITKHRVRAGSITRLP
jgi:hypothetical protein